ncbi:hypothetical protein Mpal_1517 [Methanosphaerula palustris E1-9c]|uniref:Uncharacterized protein n=2 Tax=Methanosphaerula palustris TaxID=475088 RepID=B8GIL8_METPE|nr:hypothetical protein Mpal_1517 [Methanosphaerula palustris E1-9c]
MSDNQSKSEKRTYARLDVIHKAYHLIRNCTMMKFLKATGVLVLFTLVCISCAGAASTTATTVPTQTATVQTTTTPTTVSTTATTASSQAQVITPSVATVPANTGVFAIGSVGDVGVGQTAGATLYVNNAWSPVFGDTYIDITWDSSVAEYVSTDIKVSSNTTAAEGGNGHVRVALGDFKNGYPAGSYPIATINLKALKQGTTPLTVTIDHVRYWSSDLSTFTDITSSATAVSGVFSTGAVTAPTQVIVTSQTGTSPVTTTTQYIAPSGPVSYGDSSSSGNGDTYTGVGGEPTIQKTTTNVTTTVPTTVITTVNTTVNTTQTISEPTLTIETTVPTEVQTIPTTVPTTKKAGAFPGIITLIGLAGAGLLLLAGRKN